MQFFEHIPSAIPDPLMSLNAEFRKDPRAEKVNLGVGTYRTSELTSLVMTCVRRAEDYILQAGLDKDYLPIDGEEDFLNCVKKLVFGEHLYSVKADKLVALQALGGTGSLRIGADLLSRNSIKKIYVSDLSWPNHKPIFSAAGMQVDTYVYYDSIRHMLDFSGLCDCISRMERGSVILLHACCHNPTGIDPDKKQWEELAALIHQKELLPYFDFAYQGLGTGIEEDGFSIRLFSKLFEELLIGYSFSKNFGLYGERVGALVVQTANPAQVPKIISQGKVIIRENYSTPPCHGARIVKFIYENHEWRTLWQMELAHMRERLIAMRRAFTSGLAAKNALVDVDAINKQVGLFAYFGLGKDQVERLTREFAIYLPANGRINLAGLNASNMGYVIDAIMSVLE